MSLPSTGAIASRDHYTLLDQERMSKAKNYFAWQGRIVKPHLGRRVIEFGCGAGNFTSMLLDRDAVIAVDVEPECVERLQQRYPNQANLHVCSIDADGFELSKLARFRPDSCVCLNVLEHIADDRRALVQMASILPPGAPIVLIMPAFPALMGPIDRSLRHYRRYRRESMRNLARAAGLQVEKLRYMNFIGFFGWWMNASVFRLAMQSRTQIGIFDRFIVPVMSRIERVLPPPFGQSLFVVLRKP
ncbi:MAG TPA: methyltransferase domain-containing protein [Bryobacteraceae bacterium]|nr:methyltransferase domain-containing protein [Bryobacteraceae bacterium]